MTLRRLRAAISGTATRQSTPPAPTTQAAARQTLTAQTLEEQLTALIERVPPAGWVLGQHDQPQFTDH
jgi:hypothetical protein